MNKERDVLISVCVTNSVNFSVVPFCGGYIVFTCFTSSRMNLVVDVQTILTTFDMRLSEVANL